MLDGKLTWDEPPGQVLRDHADVIRRFLTEQGVQTNEVQRCYMLLPCFLELARRAAAETIELVELGPSAGLNLLWDLYHYRYAAGEWGDVDAEVELTGDERAPVPADLLATRPAVRARVGIDLAPVDVTSEEGVRLLRSFIWPDQARRFEALERAIDVVRRERPPILQGDVLEHLPRLLDQRPADALTIVWHTATLEYLPRERREEVYRVLETAGADGRPLGFIETTTTRVHGALTLRSWPGGGVPEHVGFGDFHGAWVDWRG